MTAKHSAAYRARRRQAINRRKHKARLDRISAFGRGLFIKREARS